MLGESLGKYPFKAYTSDDKRTEKKLLKIINMISWKAELYNYNIALCYTKSFDNLQSTSGTADTVNA